MNIDLEQLKTFKGYSEVSKEFLFREFHDVEKMILKLMEKKSHIINTANSEKEGGGTLFFIAIAFFLWALNMGGGLGLVLSFISLVLFFIGYNTRKYVAESDKFKQKIDEYNDFINALRKYHKLEIEKHSEKKAHYKREIELRKSECAELLNKKEILQKEKVEIRQKIGELESNLIVLKRNLSNFEGISKKDLCSKVLKDFASILPFYISGHDNDENDDFRLKGTMDALRKGDLTTTTLYFVKIKSLLDDQDYFKVGVTSVGINDRFEKSTQVELVEVILELEFPKYLALYLEYVFVKEFKLTDKIATALGVTSVSLKFSGFTEIVRPNSIEKITKLLVKTKSLEENFNNSYNSRSEELEKYKANEVQIKVVKEELDNLKKMPNIISSQIAKVDTDIKSKFSLVDDLNFKIDMLSDLT